MAGRSEQERKDQAAKQKGNLGQKEAELEKQKESELEHRHVARRCLRFFNCPR